MAAARPAGSDAETPSPPAHAHPGQRQGLRAGRELESVLIDPGPVDGGDDLLVIGAFADGGVAEYLLDRRFLGDAMAVQLEDRLDAGRPAPGVAALAHCLDVPELQADLADPRLLVDRCALPACLGPAGAEQRGRAKTGHHPSACQHASLQAFQRRATADLRIVRPGWTRGP
jgi:hypothetical protein